MPTRKRPRSPHRNRNRRSLADLPSRTSWEDTPHKRGLAFPSRIRRYRYDPLRSPIPLALTTFMPPFKPPGTLSRPGPTTARPSPRGDGSCHERGPHHTRLLVSQCPHRCTKRPRVHRLSATVSPKRNCSRKALRSPSLCLAALALIRPLMDGYPHIHASRQGERPLGYHTSVTAKGSPTQGPSLYNRTPPFVRYIVTVAIPVSRRATKMSST